MMTETFRQSLRKRGYDEIDPNLFILPSDDGCVIWKYTGDAWVQTFEFTETTP